MKNIIIAIKKEYILLFNEAENEYEIIKNLEIINQGEYRGDVLNYYRNDIHGLFGAVDEFIGLTEKEHIPYYRLMELATLFKDGLIEDDKDTAMEYFDEVCDMREYEKESFGIEKVE